MTHSMILEIYKPDEEIPDYMMNLIVRKYKKPKHIMITSGIGAKLFEEALKDLIDRKANL